MKFFFRFLIFLLIYLLSSSNCSINSQTDNINKNNFYIGAQGFVFHEYFPYFQQLSFNTYVDWGMSNDFQRYSTWQGGFDRIYGGFYDTLVGQSPPYNPYPLLEQLPDGYRFGEQYFLTQWHNIMNSTDAGSVFLGSSRVYRSCMGQRSTYQVERYDENGIEWTSKYPGYGYSVRQIGSPYSETWMGEAVRGQVCHVMPDAENLDANNSYIVKSLFENGEQSDVISRREYGTALYSDQKRIGDNFHWFVKPRMRLDANFANNQNNWSKKVVKIEVYNYAGTLLTPTKDITVFDFLDNNNYYDGKYIENFIDKWTGEYILSVPAEDLVLGADSSRYYSDPNLSNIDYRIYWYGEADVWLDYVRLDDEWAHFLFTDPWGSLDFSVNPYQFARRMHDEVASINSTGGLALFYQDEFYWNHIPCMSETNRLIKQWASNSGIIVMTSYSPGLKHKPTTQQLYDRLKAEGLYNDFVLIDKYPIFYNTPLPPNLYVQDSIRQNYAAISYPGAYQNSSNTLYNQHINENIYEQDWYRDDYQRAADVIKTSTTNTAFISTIQAHSWEDNFLHINCGQSIDGWEFRRDPTNEEIGLQAYFSMCYGAKHIHYFMQWSGMDTRTCDNTKYCNNGLTAWWNVPGINEKPPRYINYYGQAKWDFIASLDVNLMKIGKYLYNQNNLKYDVAYSIHKDGYGSGIITNLVSYYRMPFAPFDFNLIGENADAVKYWEVGYFTDNSLYNKYFMLLNMRCVPETPGVGDGDLRAVKIYLNTSSLPNYNTWRLINPITKENISFNKNNIANGINVPGIFNPAEGKLFKLEPVPPTGGELLAEEIIPAGENFTLTDTIFTNGYDLTIEGGAHLYFTDTSTIVVDGGKFTAGTPNSPGATFSAETGNTFHGLNFTGGAEVKIYNSTFSGLANDTTYAVNIVSCPLIDIRNNSFSTGSNTLSGAINITYYSEPVINNIYIGGNTFDAGTSSIPFVNLMSYAGTSTPALIENNTFTSTSGACGLMLSGVTGGAVKSNTFTNFGISVTALSSSIDVYGNTFTNESATSTGIEGLSGTELRLNKVGSTFIGGRNSFSNNQSSSRNITVDYSYYLLDGGENIFNISDDNESKHLKGIFPDPITVTTNETVNCFKINQSVSAPVVDVTSDNSPVSFIFTPYLSGCDPNGGGDEMVINLGNGIYDTLYQMPGSGGVSERQTSISNFGLSIANSKSEIKNSRFEIQAKQLYDSICIQMRYRNYGYVKDRCNFMLNTYTDSVESIYAAHKLYLAVSVTDTTSSGKTALKTLFETLILNNPNNTALVKKCNYLVQKCKVLLHQYSSALAGFQQIVNNNPYSYEGLVAHWDYMATSLLIQGGAGSISNFGLSIANLLSDKSDKFDKSDESDKSGDPNDKFTKEERKQIIKTVNQSYESTRESGQKKIEALTKQASEGNTESAKQVKQMRTLEQVVTIQKPKNLFEHINIVKSDLKRVFGNDNSGNSKNNNIIPSQFMLSQNYPNPFNPTTTIEYALPKDVKVVIKIYDILGREVEALVNEFKKAGYYEVKFNGSNFASGVYFYRIESDKFVVSKKMVLIK